MCSTKSHLFYFHKYIIYMIPLTMNHQQQNLIHLRQDIVDKKKIYKNEFIDWTYTNQIRFWLNKYLPIHAVRVSNSLFNWNNTNKTQLKSFCAIVTTKKKKTRTNYIVGIWRVAFSCISPLVFVVFDMKCI